MIISLITVIFKEKSDKKLTYFMLGDNVIYDAEKDLLNLKRIPLTNKVNNISIIAFNKIPDSVINEPPKYRNINFCPRRFARRIYQ